MYAIKTIPEDFLVEEIFSPPEKEGDYYYIILELNNEETLYAIERLAKKLGTKSKNIGYGGIKDKRAVTKQYLSINGVSKEKIESVGFRIVGSDNKSMSLGDHEGNKFKIVIRNLDEDEVRNLKEKLSKIKGKYKFVNFFGEQRFSSKNIDVGIAILQRDFRNACNLVRHNKIKAHLEKYPSDYTGAFSKLPKKLIMLFVHAFQSKIWNILVERFDDEIIPIPGYMTEFKNEEIKKLCENYLSDLDMNFRSFAIREIPNLFTGGSERERTAIAENFYFSKFENDELNQGRKKITVSFELKKSVYATVCIESLLRK